MEAEGAMFASVTKILPLAALSMVAAAWAQVPPDAAASGALAPTDPVIVSPVPSPVPLLAPEPPAIPIPALLPQARAIDPGSAGAKDPTGASGLLAADAAPAGAAPGAVPKMATVTVTGSQVPDFPERELDTTKGMIAASFKRHPGLHVGNAFDLNANAAHELFLADDWRSTMRDYSEMAKAMADGGDPAESRMILSEVNDEDMEMRAQGNNDSGLPAFDRLQVGQLDNDSKLLQVPERPVDISIVRVKW